MKSLIRKLHQWHLETVFNQTVLSLPLRRGFEGLNSVFSNKVRRVSKWRFIAPFDYGIHRDFYGYWDKRCVYVRLRLRPANLLEFFGTGRVSHFKGKIVETENGPYLTGSYGIRGFFRSFVMLLIYLPFFLITYGLLTVIYSDFQNLQRGDYRALSLDSLIYLAQVFFVWVFWGGGYLIGRFCAASTARERQRIHDLLASAAFQ
jgi:hypothetical protein